MARICLIILFWLLSLLKLAGQNTISGTITSVPSNIPAVQTRITFTNTTNGNKYSQLTTNGTFTINLPSGTYQIKIEGLGNYLVLDTLTINSSQTLNDQIIDDETITEPTFAGTRSLLWMIKEATVTMDAAESLNGTIRYNVFENDFRTGPIKVYANRANIPAQYLDDLDAVLLGESDFVESPTDDLNEGVSFRFYTDITWPATLPAVAAYTVQDAFYDSHHSKHWTISFNLDKFNGDATLAQRSFKKELKVRVESLNTFGPDFIYVMSTASATNTHSDEVKIIKRINALKDGTVMKKHRDVVITSVPNTFFTNVSVTTPASNSTINYDGAGNFPLTHSRNGQLDADGDAVSQIWKIYKNNVLYKMYAVNHNNTITINKSEFTPSTTYTATVTLSDGVLSVTSPAISFTTPAGTAPVPGIEITGTITSVPSNIPAAQTRITFTNTGNGSKYSQLTTNGSFNISLPAGTYERKIEGIGNYQVLDEVVITGSTTLNEKIIDVEPLTSTVYGPSGQNRSLLYLLKLLTNSDGVAGNTLLYRVTNQNPWRLYARNYNVSDPESMPSDLRPDFDYVLNEIATKIPEITFNEQTTENLTNGISFKYPLTVNMPVPFVGYTEPGETDSQIYIDREKYHNFSREREIILREIFVRSTLLYSLSTDPAFATNTGTTATEIIHPDEVNVARRMLNLTYLSDMSKHRDVAIATIPNTIFTTVSITAPANNSTVVYDGSGNFSFTHSFNGQRDAEGDALAQTWKIYKNNILYKTYTASHNNAVTVNKIDFTAHTTYTATVTLSDGFLEVTSPAITFTTPNVLPTQAITSPANNATVSYDANNRFEIVTTPNTATDADGDNLIKTISIYVMPLNTLVKSVTTANNNQVFVLKSELNPHTSYAIKATLTDGVSTTSEVTSNFTTPNLLPAIAITSPANSATVSYDANNRFEIITTPGSATDADDDLLMKTIEVRKASNNALIKTVTTANTNQVFVLKSELEPHTAYIIRATLTDMVATTAVVTSNFNTPNTLPPAQAITSPANNSTISYDVNNRFEIITSPATATDADGDNLSKTIEIRKTSNNVLVKTVTTANNSQVFILKTDLEAHTAYSIKATLTDGIATTAVVSSNFGTPNTLPPTQTITNPANNSTINYDANNQFEIVTTPNSATDADGDNLTKTIEVRKVSNNALVKTVTTANNNQVFVLKSELEPQTTYQIKATLTDGLATSAQISLTFVTPVLIVNTIPTQAIVSPVANATVSYDANNIFEIITSPATATDAEGDNLNKTIEVRKASNNTLIKSITTANNNQVFVSKTELEAHTLYTIKATLTDGILTTTVVSSNFSTPNTIPVQEIISPVNNATVSFDSNDRLLINTTPNSAKDSDNDNLTKTIRVTGTGLDTLITKPNETQVYLMKSRLQPNTSYTIEATLTDGIETTPVKSIIFRTPVVVGIMDELNELKIYPNPFSDKLTIESPDNLKVRIISSTGIEVFCDEIFQRKTIMLDFSAGVYLLLITGNEGTVIKKLVKR